MSEQLWSDERIRSVIKRFTDPADVAIAVRDDYQHRLSLLETGGQWPSGYPERVEELLGELAAAQERINSLTEERDMYKAQAGMLEDNGRMAAWRMVNAEDEVKALRTQLADMEAWGQACDDIRIELEVQSKERIAELEAEADEWRQRHAECTTALITADRKEQPHD